MLRSILVTLVIGMLFSCENKLESIIDLTTVEELPSESTRNIEVMYSDSAQVLLKLIAPKVDRFNIEKPYSEFPEGIKLMFYDARMKVESQITADYAINYESEGKMIARENVVVINKKGEKLNTEHLIWDSKNEKIISNEFVTITTDDEVIFGDTLIANQDFSEYEIKNIKGIIQIETADEDETDPEKAN